MDDLRLNCPWDKRQTLDSLKRLTVEETYELNDAIENKNFENIKEELGDLLLHIVVPLPVPSTLNLNHASPARSPPSDLLGAPLGTSICGSPR